MRISKERQRKQILLAKMLNKKGVLKMSRDMEQIKQEYGRAAAQLGQIEQQLDNLTNAKKELIVSMNKLGQEAADLNATSTTAPVPQETL